MALQRPTLVLALENEDASSALAGILWLKGCDVYKTKSATDCIEQINKLEGKVDVVVTSSKIALDRNTMLIVNINKMQLKSKVLVIGEDNSDKTRILDYGADEFSLKPISPENMADKIFMLLARDKVAENRSQ